MRTDPTKTPRHQEAQSALGFTRTPSEDDPRRDPQLLAALARIAPGTELRQAIDDIIRSREGALIVVGDPDALSFLYSGGIRLDQPFTPQLLYELAKMDGAIVVLTRLTALEFQNAVVLDDVLVVLQRAEMTTRMAAEIERDCVELGSEGRLIRMQLTELVGEVPKERAAVVYDYHADGPGPRAELALEGLHALPYRQLLESERLAELLGYPRDVNPLDHSVSPRGFRVLSHIPRLPEAVIRQVVRDMGDLEAIVRASQRDLEAIGGVGTVRAREIR